jgi:hypothetical protein
LKVDSEPDVVLDRDPLAQLSKRGVREHPPKLGLPREDDLKQLLRIGLEVGEQANLLQVRHVEILGFVDDQHGVQVVVQPFQQECVEGDDVIGLRLEVALDLEFGDDQLEEIDPGQRGGVQHHAGIHLSRDAVDGGSEKGRLPGTDLSGEQDEALAAGDPVVQGCEPFLVGFRQP